MTAIKAFKDLLSHSGTVFMDLAFWTLMESCRFGNAPSLKLEVKTLEDGWRENGALTLLLLLLLWGVEGAIGRITLLAVTDWSK